MARKKKQDTTEAPWETAPKLILDDPVVAEQTFIVTFRDFRQLAPADVKHKLTNLASVKGSSLEVDPV